MKYCLKCGNELADYATLCNICGTPVQQAQPAPQTPVQPQSFDYIFPPVTPAKKSKKGLLFGIIGGVVLLIAAALVWFFCFAGGNVEFGMNATDTHDAMLSNGFTYAYSNYINYMDQPVESAEYKGEVDDLGTCVVHFAFNAKKDHALYECEISTKADLAVVKEFVSEKLDADCKEYNNPDRNEENETPYVYLCENGTKTAIISVYEFEDEPENNYIYISFCDSTLIPENEKDSYKEALEEIKNS